MPSLLQTYPSRSPPAQNFANCLFVSLFDCYLSHFLPYTGIVPPSPTNSLSQGHSLYTRSPRLSTSFGSPVGQSPSYGATSPMRRGAKICIGSPKQSPQVTQSETFVQVGGRVVATGYNVTDEINRMYFYCLCWYVAGTG